MKNDVILMGLKPILDHPCFQRKERRERRRNYGDEEDGR